MPSKTIIIATIGPSSSKLGIIRKMIKNQMDMARLNMSHGTLKRHQRYINLIRKAAYLEKRKIPILIDLAGPRIKTKTGHKLNPKLKTITSKDIKSILFGIKNKIDFFAISYAKSKKDVDEIRNILKKNKAENIKIISKIERKEALRNLTSIIKASDGIMVARGDLAEEIPFEKLPFVQLKIIKETKKHKKFVIVATEMLFSMKERKKPTRAEITDVTFAILEKADAVMLSDETTIGKYPVEAVKTMEKIISYAEKQINKKGKTCLCF